MKKRWEVIEVLIKNMNKNVNVLEIGGYSGKTTEYLLKNCKDYIDEYFVIDPYQFYEEYDNIFDQRTDQNKLDIAYKQMKLLEKKYSKLTLLKEFSEDCVSLFTDEYFDLIFIDANHKYEYVKKDIINWYSKVKHSGIISGHDYNYPGLDGVKYAVDELFEKCQIQDDYVWYVEKQNCPLSIYNKL